MADARTQQVRENLHREVAKNTRRARRTKALKRKNSNRKWS